MLNSIVKWSIAQRWLVVIASVIISFWGFSILVQMPLDVFPNFANAPGGFLITPDQETLVRGVGRIESIEQLKKSVIKAKNGTPVLLEQVADVQIGAALKRGDGSFGGKPAVILTVNKQPDADTPKVTKLVESAIAEIKAGLPKDIKITSTFRQEDFIEVSIESVEEALRDGTIIVSIVLILFLMNWRTVVISLSALPVSLLLGMMILNWTGQGINTMTLGGLVVAIGSVVDDAIVDMENVYRRLRENQLAGNPVPPLQVVFDGSVEVRVSVLFATIIIAVVFAPIFALSGVEGKIFTPMGLAYLLSIAASTLVALTLTPAMCALLLVNTKLPSTETWLEKQTHKIYRPALRFSLHSPKIVLMTALAGVIASLVVMTALSSALGMVPLVIGSGAGKEILQPLAVVVLGGLFTSTALTLLVLPACYMQFSRFLQPKKKVEIQDINVSQGSIV